MNDGPFYPSDTLRKKSEFPRPQKLISNKKIKNHTPKQYDTIFEQKCRLDMTNRRLFLLANWIYYVPDENIINDLKGLCVLGGQSKIFRQRNSGF